MHACLKIACTALRMPSPHALCDGGVQAHARLHEDGLRVVVRPGPHEVALLPCRQLGRRVVGGRRARLQGPAGKGQRSRDNSSCPWHNIQLPCLALHEVLDPLNHRILHGALSHAVGQHASRHACMNVLWPSVPPPSLALHRVRCWQHTVPGCPGCMSPMQELLPTASNCT